MTPRFNGTLRTLALTLASVAGLTAAASAQGFNVDFNDGFSGSPTCGPTYAAAGTAGTWNGVDGGLTNVHNLVDKAGAASSVVMTLSTSMNVTLNFANAAYVGEDANLMQDIVYGSAIETIDFSGLANGTYDVYTYAQAPDSKAGFITGVNCTESMDGLQNVGGALWPGSHVQGISYALHSATVTNGTLHLDITAVVSFDSINGLQIEPSGPGNTGSAYCFGDGTGANCPCSGFGAAGTGCINTGGVGAMLTGSGNASLGLDTFQLDVVGVPGAKPGLVLKGNNQVAIAAGDGILCTAGGSQRSHVQVTVAGATTFTLFNGVPFGAVANGGGVPTNFQFWYRDPSATCTGTGFNFTNAWTVTYMP